MPLWVNCFPAVTVSAIGLNLLWFLSIGSSCFPHGRPWITFHRSGDRLVVRLSVGIDVLANGKGGQVIAD